MKLKFQLILLFLLLPVALAEDWSYLNPDQSFDQNNFDPYDPTLAQAYTLPEFYQQVNPNLWDWTLVDWAQVDLNRNDIYSVPGFYTNLPLGKYTQIDYDKVDYTLISQEKIDSTKYFQDKGCSACWLEEKGAKPGKDFLYSVKGLEHPKTGTFVEITNYPRKSHFYVDEKKGIVADVSRSLGEEGSLSIKTDDALTIEVNKEEIKGLRSFLMGEHTNSLAPPIEEIDNYHDQELYFNDFLIIDGQLSQDSEGNTFMHPGTMLETAFLKDEEKDLEPQKIKINSNIETPKFYINPEFQVSDQDNYIFINERSLELNHYITGSSHAREDVRKKIIQVQLLEDNLVFILYNGNVEYQKRGGLIPKLTVNQKKFTSFALTAGNIWVGFSPTKDLYVKPLNLDSTEDSAVEINTPFVLEINPESGQEVKPQKLIFNDGGEFINALPEWSEEQTECLSCPTSKEFISGNIFYKKDVQKEAQQFSSLLGIPIFVEDKITSENLNQLVARLNNLPNPLKEGITSIHIYNTQEDLVKVCGEYAAACAGSDGTLHFCPEYLDQNYVDHEAGHTKSFLTEKKDYVDILCQKRMALELEKERGEIEMDEANEEIAKIDLEIEKSQKLLWGDWENIAGDIYGTAKADVDLKKTYWLQSEEGRNWYSENLPNEDDPQFSCPNAYACTNKLEHYAVLTEKGRDPNYDWKPLLSLPQAFKTMQLVQILHFRDEAISDSEYEKIAQQFLEVQQQNPDAVALINNLPLTNNPIINSTLS